MMMRCNKFTTRTSGGEEERSGPLSEFLNARWLAAKGATRDQNADFANQSKPLVAKLASVVTSQANRPKFVGLNFIQRHFLTKPI